MRKTWNIPASEGSLKLHTLKQSRRENERWATKSIYLLLLWFGVSGDD